MPCSGPPHPARRRDACRRDRGSTAPQPLLRRLHELKRGVAPKFNPRPTKPDLLQKEQVLVGHALDWHPVRELRIGGIVFLDFAFQPSLIRQRLRPRRRGQHPQQLASRCHGIERYHKMETDRNPRVSCAADALVPLFERTGAGPGWHPIPTTAKANPPARLASSQCSVGCALKSEQQLQPKLHLPRCIRLARYDAKRRRIHRRVRSPESRRIEGVEKLRAELHPRPLGDGELLK